MTILTLETFSRKSPDRQVAAFVTSAEFMSLCAVVAKAFPRNLAASFLDMAINDDLMLTWAKGELGEGVGFTLVQEENVKKIGGVYKLRPGTNALELQLTDDNGNPTKKKIQQLVMHTGRNDLSAYSIPADVVVDQSGLIVGVSLQEIDYHTMLNPSVRGNFGLKIQDDGRIRAFANKRYDSSASQLLDSKLGRDNSFLRAFSKIS